MKTLKDVLVDYDLAMWQAIAEKRGLPSPQKNNSEQLKALVADLLSPASIAIVLADLSADEQTALNALLSNQGALQTPAFTRTYGHIRPMGERKLLREKPWQNPQNPAEGLWYRGLICRGFRHTVNGPEEIIFIPSDLRQALPETIASEPPRFEVPLASNPAFVQATSTAAHEDIFTFLVFVQSNLIRLTEEDTLPLEQIRQLELQFSHQALEPPPDDAPSGWYDFLLHLIRRAKFLLKQGRRLKLNTRTTKPWLQSDFKSQKRRLQTLWRSDPTWNDLWHVPSLHPKDTGWENSPLRGRAKILEYLAHVPPGEWVKLADFVQAIKDHDPDFQRPHGDYQTWYIYNAAGEPLMGFEHWDEVEGALIRRLISHTLFVLGVVSLGSSVQAGPITHFQIVDAGFFEADPPAKAAPSAKFKPLSINPRNLTVRVPRQASLYDRFQLARFAELLRREDKRTVYHLTRQSYRLALQQSINLEQILAFLNRATQANVPLALSDTLRQWDQKIGSVQLERLTILRVNQPGLIEQLFQHPEIGPLLDRPFGQSSILVPNENAEHLQDLLIKHGFLDV